MFKRLAFFTFVFGLSHLFEALGWCDQGVAFVYINIIAMLICAFVVSPIIGIRKNQFSVMRISTIFLPFIIGYVLLLSWGASCLFGVSFTIAYQLLEFGRCLQEPCVTYW